MNNNNIKINNIERLFLYKYGQKLFEITQQMIQNKIIIIKINFVMKKIEDKK